MDHSYEPFGSIKSEMKADPTAPQNPMRFTGEYLDNTGLYHLRARQMHPEIGRFTGRDPWPASDRNPFMSPYVYANNRPSVLSDPSGRVVFIAIAIGAVIGGASSGLGAAAQGGDGGDILLAASIGAVGGGLAGTVAPLATPIGGAFLGGAGNLLGQTMTPGGTGSINACSVLVSMFTGSTGAMAGAGLASVASAAGGGTGLQAVGGGLGAFPTSVVADPIGQNWCGSSVLGATAC